MEDIQIIVKGDAKSGKSVLAQEIAAALRHCGFPVQNLHEDVKAKPPAREVQVQKLELIRNRLNEQGAAIVVSEQTRLSSESIAQLAKQAIWPPPLDQRPRAEFKRPDDTEGGACD